VAAVALVVVVLVCGSWLASLSGTQTPAKPSDGALVSSMYSPARNAIEHALDSGDGQLFAAQATDPLIRRPQIITGPPSEQAYRYQRPVYGWLGWIASGGQRGAVAWALLVVTGLSVIGLVAASARLLAARGADPWFALALLATPGVIVDLTWVGPEALGTALVVLGLGRAVARTVPSASADRAARSVAADPLAIACFAAAGLCRETLLLVPAVLVVLALVDRQIRTAVSVATAALPYLLWVVVVRLRIGAWPTGSEGGRVSLVPFGGMVRAMSGWTAGDVAFALLVLGAGTAALVLTDDRSLRWLIGAHLILAASLGAQVWTRYADFGRVLLPLGALSLLALAPARLGPAREGAVQRPTNSIGGEAASHAFTFGLVAGWARNCWRICRMQGGWT
jgi:hypothetical protein